VSGCKQHWRALEAASQIWIFGHVEFWGRSKDLCSSAVRSHCTRDYCMTASYLSIPTKRELDSREASRSSFQSKERRPAFLEDDITCRNLEREPNLSRIQIEKQETSCSQLPQEQESEHSHDNSKTQLRKGTRNIRFIQINVLFCAKVCACFKQYTTLIRPTLHATLACKKIYTLLYSEYIHIACHARTYRLERNN
jgi:hypothetical protein